VKDKRIISVKGPKLLKVRNELREVLLQARDAELRKIRSEMEKIDSNEVGDSIPMDELAPSQLKRFRELQQMESVNREIGDKSICMCFNCGRADRDMYYNHPYRAWFCVECMEFLRKGYSKMVAKKVRGEYMCDPDDEFGQSFF